MKLSIIHHFTGLNWNWWKHDCCKWKSFYVSWCQCTKEKWVLLDCNWKNHWNIILLLSSEIDEHLMALYDNHLYGFGSKDTNKKWMPIYCNCNNQIYTIILVASEIDDYLMAPSENHLNGFWSQGTNRKWMSIDFNWINQLYTILLWWFLIRVMKTWWPLLSIF